MQQALGDKGHLSQATNYTATTCSGNMNLHLSQRHSVVTSNDEKTTKILGYLKKYSTDSPQPAATSSHEVNQDIAVWMCRDLLPFEMVAKDRFVKFRWKDFTKPAPSDT